MFWVALTFLCVTALHARGVSLESDVLARIFSENSTEIETASGFLQKLLWQSETLPSNNDAKNENREQSFNGESWEETKIEKAKRCFERERIETGLMPLSNGGEMFYFWVPVRNEEDKLAPITLWLTGGPGCSSAIAFFKENGPLWMSEDGEISRNPHSWSEVSNMLYVDQPLGTGFSDPGTWTNYATDEEHIAEVLRDFLVKFFERMPAMKDRPFYISGESYGGHFVPPIAELLLREPIPGVTVTGILLGNAWVDPTLQWLSIADYSFTTNLIDREQYVAAVEGFETCASLLNMKLWPVAFLECTLTGARLLGQRNPYDIRLPCESSSLPLCYNMTSVVDFMTDKDVTEWFGVKRPWVMCNSMISMFLTGDWVKNFIGTVSTLLDANVQVLVYAGDQDFIVNWMGCDSWTRAVEWRGHEAFETTSWLPWMVDGAVAGEMRQFESLSFLKMHGAGHMAPMDKPREALAMFSEFVGDASRGDDAQIEVAKQHAMMRSDQIFIQ